MAARSPLSFRESVHQLLHHRLLDAASSITCEAGWSAVTMNRIAELAGVSRQTVYNEFGSKPRIAEELIARELDQFLTLVDGRMSAETDVVAALHSAARGAFETAAANPLLKAVLDTAHTGGSDLLPLVTTESLDLIERAGATVLAALEANAFDTGLDLRARQRLVEAVVRLALSHIIRPTGSPTDAADDIAWLASRAMGRRQD